MPEPEIQTYWLPKTMPVTFALTSLPMQYRIRQQPIEGGLAVHLMFFTPGGNVWSNVISADFATQLAADLGRNAQATAAGLLLPAVEDGELPKS